MRPCLDPMYSKVSVSTVIKIIIIPIVILLLATTFIVLLS